MTDPRNQIHRIVDRLVPAESVTVPPVSELARAATARPRRSWPRLALAGVATAAVLLAGAAGWQVNGVADRNAEQRIVPATMAGNGADLAASCPVPSGDGRTINAVRWPGGLAVLAASSTTFALCFGGESGPMVSESWGGFSPGATSLVCRPGGCEGGAQPVTSRFALTSAVLVYGATWPGTARVRAVSDSGVRVEVPAQNGTFLLRLETAGTREVGVRRVEMFDATGERLYTWDWD
ncbi:hypothetical protein K7640_10625 [Micromonospora sp. PLK6-60]|uniref:hypothetical protein n=1 Tax=Micromonospora sp. PLK6-60 TaxID=2873383 RepID=UPI001CA6CFCE|nr:hypothetical protein [Micromonospora sp. PLK6-60]MBY8872293.1 hypothetical protein [Micromonospora sp. PLK6-60]